LVLSAVLLLIRPAAGQVEDEEEDVIVVDPWGKTEIPCINGALELNDTNHVDAFRAYDRMYVQFYAPWCWHSQALDEQYLPAAIEAAKEKDSGVVFAKFERTLPWHASLCQVWGIPPVTPTIRFFMNGVATLFDGDKTKDGLLSWAKSKTGNPFTKISTVPEAEGLIKNNQLVVFSFWKNLDDANINTCLMRAAALGDNEQIPFAITDSEALAKKFKVEAPAVVILRKFDSPKKIVLTSKELPCMDESIPESNEKSMGISSILDEHKIPAVMQFGEQTADIIGQNYPKKIKKVMWLLADKEMASYSSVQEAFVKVALPRKKTQISVAVSDRAHIATLMSHFTLDAEAVTLPIVLMARFNAGRSKQEQFILQQGSITPEGLEESLAALEGGKLSPNIRSERIVDDAAEDLKVIVGHNWEEKLIKPMKDTLVLFTHRSKCTKSENRCQAVQESMVVLAKAVSHIETLTVAQMDLQFNEIDHQTINKLSEFPALYLFCATDKKKPIRVDARMLKSINGAEGAAALVGFLQNNAHIYFDPPDINSDLKPTDEL